MNFSQVFIPAEGILGQLADQNQKLRRSTCVWGRKRQHLCTSLQNLWVAKSSSLDWAVVLFVGAQGICPSSWGAARAPRGPGPGR